MKKLLLASLVLCLVIVLAGCSASRNAKHSTNFEMRSSEKTYKIDESVFQSAEFREPAGIAFVSEQVIIADSGSNCLFVFDENGEYSKKIGSIGKGPLQFFSPTSICYQDGLLYVLDARNNRIQVLDDQFSYARSFELTPIDSEISYKDIVVGYDGDIYVTSAYSVKQYAHIYRIDTKTETQYQIGTDVIGSLTITDSGTLLFANSYEITHEKGSTVAKSGSNYLYDIKDNKLHMIAELPYKYATQDFLHSGENLYALSLGYASLDKFSLDGDYIETLYEFPDVPEGVLQFNCLVYQENEDYFLASSPTTSKVYCIRSADVKRSLQ